VTDIPVGCVSLPVPGDGLFDFGPDTAIDIVFTGIGGSCSVTAERFDTPPTEPVGVAEIFIGDYYWSIGAPVCTFAAGTEIRFDLDELPGGGGFLDPSAINVYKRSSGETEFSAVPSVTYDAATNEIVVSGLTGFSEFVFASDTGVGVAEEDPVGPGSQRGEFSVGELYPNPSGLSTNIDVTTGREQRVSVAVYDVTGRRVASVFEGRLGASAKRTFSVGAAAIADLAAGTYVVVVRGDTVVESRSLVVVK
jgi:hypothetical protein